MKGKVIVITGGASGLGHAITTDLISRGATVAILDINVDNLAKPDTKFETHQIDITDYDQVQTTIDTIVETHSKIDVLVNNAGIIHSEPLINLTNPSSMKHSYESFKRTLELDLNSVFIMTSIVAEKMVMKRTRGCIINMSSISAQGNAGQTAYSAAKGAVESMTKTWGKELGVFGIRTNAIAPGFIDTPSTANALNPSIIQHVRENTPLRRLGEIGNIAQAVAYIIDNEFVNASILAVDGGLTI